MAVKLRLRREGTKKRPHYRVVAADSRSPRNGRFIEIIGEYHPLEEPSAIRIDGERAMHYLTNGAQPSDAVKKLLRIEGIWDQFKPNDKPARDRSAKNAAPVLSKKAKEKAREAAEAKAAPAPVAAPEADAEASE